MAKNTLEQLEKAKKLDLHTKEWMSRGEKGLRSYIQQHPVGSAPTGGVGMGIKSLIVGAIAVAAVVGGVFVFGNGGSDNFGGTQSPEISGTPTVTPDVNPTQTIQPSATPQTSPGTSPTPSPGATVGPKPTHDPSLIVTVTTDQEQYFFDEQIRLTIQVTNDSNESKSLSWVDVCQISYDISGPTKLSDTRFCADKVDAQLKPGESKKWNIVLDEQFAVGSYVITGVVTGYGSNTTNVTIRAHDSADARNHTGTGGIGNARTQLDE